MYERFTDRARKVMQLANQEAQRFNHEYIGTEHMLLGIIKEGSGVAANVLKNLDIDLRKVRLEVEKIVQTGPGGDQGVLGKLPHTPRAKKVIEYSVEEARGLNHNYVGTEHLLLGLLREQEGVAAQVLINLGLNLEDVRVEVMNLLGHNLSNDQAGTSTHQIRRRVMDDSSEWGPSSGAKTPRLDEVGHDLTRLAWAGDLRPVIGREAELAALVEVLSCRTRKNAVLLGEPGIGRSTLVAGLARAIAEGRAPEWLRSWRVVLLFVGDLWSDGVNPRVVSQHARIIFDEVRRARDTVLYFPDAVASLGIPDGGSVAERVHAQLLTALWTDQVPCILSATPAEYQRCLRRRPALGGSVQPIVLHAATVQETVAVLHGVRDRYESRHWVTINDEALAAAAAAAAGLPGVLPGKAVVLMDRAAARARIRAAALPPDVAAAVRELDERIDRLNREKEDLVGALDFERAAERRNEVDALRQEKKRLLEQAQAQSAVESMVDAALVAEVARDLAGDTPPAAA
jgi:ATP-dependent Clp protease ATP-binding subunit ClpC